MANKIPLAYADVELQLTTAIEVGQTTFSVASANDDDGVALPSGQYCFTIDNGSNNKQYLLGQLNGVNVTAVKSVSRQGVETTGAVRKHRVGSSCILTDFATIQRVADALRGLVDLDGASPIGYDAEPTLVDRKDMATVGYVLDRVTGGTVTFDNQIVTGVLAGETIVAGDSVYLKESDQRWWKTAAATVATVENVQQGIALGAGSVGVAIVGGVLLEGVYTTTGLTAGSRYFLSDTAGVRALTTGTNPLAVGLALSTTRLLFSPSRFNISTFNEKAALAGGGSFGTPSGSNKFATEAFITAKVPTVQTFNVSGTWTKPAGLKYVVVEVQAPGGGGGGASNTSGWKGAGGGGGGYSKKTIGAASLGATETITIGAVGTGGNNTGTGGTSGAATSFGAHATTTGGGGGGGTNVGGQVGGVGGAGSSGDLNIPGSNGCSTDNVTALLVGNGGGSQLGASIIGQEPGSAGTNPGNTGASYGGGGGGGGRANTGGSGAPGIIIVTEYYT